MSHLILNIVTKFRIDFMIHIDMILSLSLPDSYCHNRHVSQNLIYNHDCHFTLSDRRAAAKIFGFDTFSRSENVQNTTAEIHVPEKLATPQLAYHFDPATGVPSTFSDPGGRELE